MIGKYNAGAQKSRTAHGEAVRLSCKKDLHQGEIQLFDLLYAGVSGVAGTAGVVISALRQEVHILRLYNVFQIGGDTYILGQLLDSVHGSGTSLVESYRPRP